MEDSKHTQRLMRHQGNYRYKKNIKATQQPTLQGNQEIHGGTKY